MKDELISREEAIRQIQKYGIGCFDPDDFIPEQAERFVINRIKELPSIQPKTGKWTYTENGNKRCSECGAVLEKDDAFWHICFYCYHCGSYNGGEE